MPTLNMTIPQQIKGVGFITNEDMPQSFAGLVDKSGKLHLPGDPVFDKDNEEYEQGRREYLNGMTTAFASSNPQDRGFYGEW